MYKVIKNLEDNDQIYNPKNLKSVNKDQVKYYI
jgi:hypothetical protein